MLCVYFPGEKGRRIRELTSVVQKRFNFKENTVELYAEKVNNRGLCAIAQAESLRYKLLGGLAVRRSVVWLHLFPALIFLCLIFGSLSFSFFSDLKAIDPIYLRIREIYLYLMSYFDESKWGNF